MAGERAKPITAIEVRNIDVFSQLSEPEVEHVLPLLSRRHLARRASLHLKETLDGKVCFACSGDFKVVAPSRRGQIATIYQFKQGGAFGHVSAILGHPMPSTLRLVAAEGGDLAVLSAPAFASLMEEIPSVCRLTTRSLAILTKDYAERVFDLIALDVRARLVSELRRLSRQSIRSDGVYVLEHAPSHAELAASIGASRESVSRAFQDLELDRLVVFREGAAEFRDIDKLIAADEAEAGERFFPETKPD